jgi:MFS family permease
MDKLYSKITWRILPILIIGYILAYLDRVNVGFAKLQMLSELQFSNAVYGLGAAIFFIGYFIFEVPSNLMLHKVGAKRWLARIMFTWALLSGACMFINNETTFYILRFLLGAAEAGFFPGTVLYITYWFPGARQARALALLTAGVALSGIIGSPLSGAIMHYMDGVNGLGGWRWMFLLEAIPTFLFGFVYLAYLPNGPQDAKFLNDFEKMQIQSPINQRPQEDHDLLGSLKDPKVWKLATMCFAQLMGTYGFTFWIPSLIVQAGVTGMLNVGLVTAIPYTFAILWSNTMAWHSDKYDERHWHHTVCALMGVNGLLLFIFASSANQMLLSIAGLTLACGGLLSLSSLFWPIANQ